MADGHKDYSGTPLWRKLGIREGARVVLVAAPAGFRGALGTLAPVPDDVRFLARATKDVDVAVVFTTRLADLIHRFPALADALKPDGRLWIAWPKKASPVTTDLTFATVQRLGLDSGLVDNKTAAIDEVFQECQFVYRLKDRAKVRPR